MVPKISLKKFISARIANGHPWIYANEIEHVEGNPEPGDIVDVFTFSRQFVGRGYYNPRSLIRARLLTRSPETIDTKFFEKRLQRALSFRERFLEEKNVARLVYGAADGLSGLVIDRLENTLVVQVNTYGMERFKEDIFSFLVEKLHPLSVFEKSDSSSREKEGLEPVVRWVSGQQAEAIPFSFSGLDFFVEPRSMQKTGFYLDQRMNALLASQLCYPRGVEVLDAFCNTGQFGLRMLQQGAREITFLDQSQEALRVNRELLRINGFAAQKQIEGNAFDVLRGFCDERRSFDVVILDPPSFTRSRSSKGNALRGYKEVNLRGMDLLRPGGFLVTSSCSQAVSRQDFEMMVYSASTDRNAMFRLVYRGGQPLDHPVVSNIFETEYLKFYIYQKVENP